MKHSIKILLSAVLGLFIVTTSCETGGESSESNFSVDFEKYTLDNGLQVVVHRDNSDPIVAVAVQYHVGSNREKPGKTGFAHFFEHMLFQNSENVGAGKFIETVNALGGSFNGGTSPDGTIYYETVPSDALEKVLWLESDRMGFFINTVSEWGLENEKQVVKNEKRQGVDNRPYGFKRGVQSENLYPYGHPYSWSVIGSLEDLQNATLEDVKEFYYQWYGPNNATLSIAGDVDEAQVKELVEKYFGEIQSRDEVETLAPRNAVLDKTKLYYYEDKFANLPDLEMIFPTVEQYNEDMWALDMLGQILSSGKNSILYKTIVEDKKLAPGIFASNRSSEIAGTFNIGARGFDGVNLNEMRDAIDEAFKKFEAEGVNEADLNRLKIRQETGFYNGISSVFGKAAQLASYNVFAGDPGFVKDDLNKTLDVTSDDIMRVYNKYIKDQHYLATSFVPVGQKSLVLEGSELASVDEEVIVQGAEGNLDKFEKNVQFEKTASKIDRSTAPELSGSLSFSPPAVNTHKLDNGIKVYHIFQDELPLVQFSLRIKGGMLLENPNKVGVSSLLDNMLMEGTASKTPKELEEALGELGASLRVSSSREFITIRGSSLAKNYGKVLALLEEVLLEPRWDEKEFARIKSSALNAIQQSNANPNVIASRVFNNIMYGDDHIFSKPTSGTSMSVSTITLDDLKAYYNKNFSPKVASFHFVGAIKEADVMASLDGLSVWNGDDVVFPNYEVKTKQDGSRIYFVDYPDAKQSVINIGSISMNGDDEDFAAATMANYRLGSGSGAILFKKLRLEKGYTYGAYSGFSRTMNGAPFTASSSVRTNVTKESVDLFKDILDNYGEDFSQQDLETTKSSILRSNTQSYETMGSLLNILQNISTYDLPTDYIKKDEERLKNMKVEDVQQLVKEYMDPDKLIYVVVGDGKTQLNRLNNLGLGKPVVVNKDEEKLTIDK